MTPPRPLTCPEDHPATATTCPEDQALAPTCPEDHPLLATTCPEDQALAPTCPEDHPLLAPHSRLPARSLAAGPTCPEDQPALAAEPVTFLPPGGPGRAVLRTVALILWATLAPACRDDAADPVRTAQLFTAAVQRADMKAVFPLLEQAAADRLTRAAEQASDQVGGRRRLGPAEMLQIVDLPPTFELTEAVLVDNDGATAHVRLVGAQQENFTLTLVREDGAWHVRIPTPP